MADPITWAVSLLGSEIGGAIGGAMMIYAEEIAIGTMIVGTLALGSAQQARARRKARDAYNASLSDRLITVRSAIAPARIVLGRCRVGGQVAYIASTGENQSKLAMVVALAAHEVDAVESVWFNDAPVTLDADGWVTDSKWRKQDLKPYLREYVLDTAGSASIDVGAGIFNVGTTVSVVPESVNVVPSDGTVVPAFSVSGNTVTLTGTPGATGTIAAQVDAGEARARVLVHLGGAGQVVDPVLQALFPAAWDASHRGDGIAYLVVLLDFDTDVFQSGVPNVSAVVRGARCYDPRTGVTAWSENPAILLRHYAGSPLGGRMTAAQLAASDDQVIAAANVCDTSASWTIGGTAGSGPLYSAGIMATTDQRPWDVMQQLTEAMAGKIAFVGNRLSLRAGAWVAPVLQLRDDDFAGGGISVQPKLPREQLFNVITGSFSDPANGWQVVDMPRVAASAWIAEDGAELPLEVEYAAVNRAWQAQHIAAIALRELRQGLTVTASFKLAAYRVELFDTIALSCARYGWTAKPFIVLNRRWTLGGGIELTLREIAASVYDLATSFEATDSAPNTLLPSPWLVGTVNGLRATSGNATLLLQSDGTVVPRILAAWDAVDDPRVRAGGRIQLRWSQITGAEFAWQTAETEGNATSLYLTGVEDGAAYIIQGRLWNGVRRGAWCVQIVHVVQGKTAAPPDVQSLTVLEQPGLSRSFHWLYAVAPADLDGFEVRYCAGTTQQPWDAMLPLFEASPNARSRTVSAPADGTWTFAIRAVDTSGNVSLNPVYCTASFDAGALGGVLASIDAGALGWPGTRVGCAPDGSYFLVDAGTPSWDTIPTVWDEWESLGWGGASAAPIAYTHSTVDLGSVRAAHVRATSLAVGTVTTEYQSSTDGVAWSAWAAIPAAPIAAARYVRVRWTVSGSTPVLYRAYINVYA